MFKLGDRVVTTSECLPFFGVGCAGTVVNITYGGTELEVLFDSGQKVKEDCDRTWWVPLSSLKIATTCRVTKHKEEYRDKIRPLNEAVHRANDPATSKGKRKVNKYEQAVLNALSQGGAAEGMTGKEIAAYHDLPLNCITPRFAPLRRKGLIKAKVDYPMYDEEPSIVKRDKQIVWVLA